MTRFSSALNQFLLSFETCSRDDGSEFLKLSSVSPEWMTEAVKAAHDDELPNESRYELIRDCLQALSDDGVESQGEALESSLELSIDLLPTHTSELLRWFSDMPRRLGDCDEALNQGRVLELTSYRILCEGFKLAAQNVISSLADSLEDASDSMFNPDLDCDLLLSDSHGVYIPRLWAEGISKAEARELGVDWWAVETCQHGPDVEHYWDAWQEILDSAEWEENGIEWRLHQNGDLWKVRADAVLPEGF